MPILHESDDEIVIGRDWWLNWLLKPTRIMLDKAHGVVKWRGVFSAHSRQQRDIYLVEVVSKRFDFKGEPQWHEVNIVMRDMTRTQVAGDPSFHAIEQVAKRMNEFTPWDTRGVSYRDEVEQGSGNIG